MNAGFRIAALLVAGCCIAVAHSAIAQSAVTQSSASNTQTDPAIKTYLRQLARPLGAEVLGALGRIDGTGRQLLALRSYIRAQSSLASRWSWSEAEIADYTASPQYRDMTAEIERITAQFERSNPGFTLYANTDVRSLDEQIDKWNSNATVQEIGEQLLTAAREQVQALKRLPPSARQAAFREFLLAWQPEVPAPLAAPGLSLHGRGRALDFQVQQGERIVAGTDTGTIASVWMAEGWAQKLAAAIEAASSKFKGPLTAPNEPWHFEYQP